MGFVKSICSANEREIRRFLRVVDKINTFEPTMQSLTDEQLRAKTDEFKKRIAEAVAEADQALSRAKQELAEAEEALAKAVSAQQGLRLSMASPDAIRAAKDKVEQIRDDRKSAQYDVERAEKQRKEAGEKALDALLPEAFAVVREAGVRVIGPKKARHFDVQMIGAMVLHQGRIAEMKTGEGKTLTATLALYLNALEGKGAHLVTVNDYLARRDARWYGPIYSFLGLTVGSIHGQSAETGESRGSYKYDPEYEPEEGEVNQWPQLRSVSRREAYQCDITYGTNSEFGFDYLYDNMAFSKEQLVQRDLNYAIVDEVDSILVDEARTPLIISGQAEESTELYHKLSRIVARLKQGVPPEQGEPEGEAQEDFYAIPKDRKATITARGVERVEEMLGVNNLADPENLETMQHINAAMQARGVFKKDVDYVVKEGQIIIVDEFTGRLMFGRRYADGLHQAIEAKENVHIQNESQTLATITYQNYFRMYKKLAGMTGTALTEENEFRKIYALDVVEIPTNKPMIRQDYPDVIYKTEEAKFRGLAMEILKTYARQQPALVGTRSIEVSERVSERLISERLQLLAATIILRARLENAKDVDGETRKKYQQLLNSPFGELTIPRLSGLAKLVGVNTDMTSADNIEDLAAMLDVGSEGIEHLRYALKEGIPRNVLNAKYHEMEAQIIAEAGRKGAVTIATNMAGRGVDIVLGGAGSEETDGRSRESLEVVEVGGLHIIGSERHESRRIDNQLRGRSGRQGDPGSSRFFVSLEDYLYRAFGDKSKSMLLGTWPEDMAMDHKLLSMAVERAQKKVEAHNFEARKQVLQYDDVMNVQRETIYSQRRKILDGANLRPTILEYLHDSISNGVMSYCSKEIHPSEWDTKGLFDELNQIFPLQFYARPQDMKGKSADELEEFLHAIADRTYEDRENEIGADLMRDIERHVALQIINDKWIYHLDAMDFLREGIGLQGYAQKDPLIAYKKEAFEMFEQMLDDVQADIVRAMYTVKMQQPQVQRRRLHVTGESGGDGGVSAGQAESSSGGSEPRVTRKTGKVGRNDPCPCGSGKKYKKCCLEKDPVA